MAIVTVLTFALSLVAQPGDDGTLQFIGNATVLVRYGGFTILTDPAFAHAGDEVPLGLGLTTTRLVDPAVAIAKLPPIDVVVVSHLHGDHFDPVAEASMDRRIPIITTLDGARALGERGFLNTHGLKTFESYEITKGSSKLRITALPARHGPAVVAWLLPPTMGSMLELYTATNREPLRIYLSGDTLFFDGLEEIPRRYPNIDVALLHLGGARMLGVMVTADDEDGLQLLKLVDAQTAVPIHFNDFDVFSSPLQDFQRAVEEEGLQARVHYLRHGDVYRFDEPVTPVGGRAEPELPGR